MQLKELIDRERMRLGEDFLPSCIRLGLTEDDIKDAEKGVVESGKENALSELLKVSPDKIINSSRDR